jgi:hypothetical protein
MRGVSFQNGVEFKISIDGERWEQGDEISGEILAVAKNPGAELKPARVILAETTERKLKSKSKDGFHVLAEATTSTFPFGWKFEMPLQARISDKAGGLCILYGSQEDPHTLGILKLNVVPHHYFNDLIELMRTEFRYALKGLSAGKDGWVDAKLENLILSLRMEDGQIDAIFEFSRERVDAMKAGLQTKIEKQEITRSWLVKEFVHDFNDRINKDVATAAIESVISEYKSAGWLA